LEVNRSGFIAIVGRPNVGKSTLLNAILGEKVAIVSAKPQTTRNKITGVLTAGDTQMIFLDTPGLHRSHTKLDEHMRRAVDDSIADVDAAVLVVEPLKDCTEAETELITKLSAKKLPVILAVNKIDTVKKEALMAVIAAWAQRYAFAAVVPVSAAAGDGVKILVAELKAQMPRGPQYFPDDMLTDQPERLVVAEIIREKLLMLLSDEVPHGIAVSVESMKERRSSAEPLNVMDIEATIYCERDSHKGIIIGKGGRMLKTAGVKARADIETLLDCHVNLQLWVKVKDDWRNREGILKTLGYD
jgi:GTP-binding protein Era